MAALWRIRDTSNRPTLHPSKQKPPSLPRDVPAVVISRLSLYLRELQHLVRAGRATVSSSQLATLFGFTDAQVRKDLAYFGHFGHPGIGYRCDELIAEIRRILGTDRQWTVTMVGVGNMGRALLRYKGFATQGFRIVAAFDRDLRVVGSEVVGIRCSSFRNWAKSCVSSEFNSA